MYKLSVWLSSMEVLSSHYCVYAIKHQPTPIVHSLLSHCGLWRRHTHTRALSQWVWFPIDFLSASSSLQLANIKSKTEIVKFDSRLDPAGSAAVCILSLCIYPDVCILLWHSKLFITSSTPPRFPSVSLHFPPHHCTAYDPTSIIFRFHVFKPSQSDLPNPQGYLWFVYGPAVSVTDGYGTMCITHVSSSLVYLLCLSGSLRAGTPCSSMLWGFQITLLCIRPCYTILHSLWADHLIRPGNASLPTSWIDQLYQDSDAPVVNLWRQDAGKGCLMVMLWCKPTSYSRLWYLHWIDEL